MCLGRGFSCVPNQPLEMYSKIFETVLMKKEMYRYPKEVILEVTNRCNLKCRYCHFHGIEALPGRPLGDMKRKTWENILMQIGEWPGPVTLMTHGAGEPLLYPDLSDLLQKAKKIPHLSVGFMTNGMLLDKSWVARLIELQIDWLALSIDGVVPETHDFFRRRADLRKIEENVMWLIEEKERQGSDRPFLHFNMVGYPEILDQSLDYVRKWLPHAQDVTISKFRPVGSRRLWNGNPPFRERPCPLLYRQMVISFDGKAGLCCEDINLDVPMEDAKGNSLEETFRSSARYLEYRQAHEKGRIQDLLLCRDCHIWGGDIALNCEQIDLSGMPVKKISTPAFESYQYISSP